jgi:uncharacterized repeat protein (TIGR01451 family)
VSKLDIIRTLTAAACAFCAAFAASGQATSPTIRIRIIAEVEIKTMEADREVVHLAPANRVVPGDQVLYTVEIRNVGPGAVPMPTVILPIPAHVLYLADSATGPGADVSYSADGGHTFGRPEASQVIGLDDRHQIINSNDYTHIRWQLKKTLKSKSVAFARFRAVVK